MTCGKTTSGSCKNARIKVFYIVMNVYAPIILCFVPFVTMFALFAILVSEFSAPKGLVASLAGLLALVPITIAQFLIPGMRLFGQSKALSILLYSIVFLGLVEEAFKALALFLVGAKAERPASWLCYSLLAGMIFGCFESVIYFLRDFQNIGHGVTLNLIYLRMFTAVLVHTLCAALGGFTVYYIKNLRLNVWPLLNAVLLHGLYDYFVSFNTPVRFFCVIVILSAAIKCRVCLLQIAEEERAKNSAPKKILDPNKTIEMPKNPAIIIPVKKTVPEDTVVLEEDVADDDEVDFEQIERQAKTELKAAKKIRGSSPRMTGTGLTKSASKAKADEKAKKAAATKTAAKKDSAKTKTAGKKDSRVKAASTKTAGKPKTRAAQSASKKTASKASASKTKTTSKTKSAAAKKPASKGKK